MEDLHSGLEQTRVLTVFHEVYGSSGSVYGFQRGPAHSEVAHLGENRFQYRKRPRRPEINGRVMLTLPINDVTETAASASCRFVLLSLSIACISTHDSGLLSNTVVHWPFFPALLSDLAHHLIDGNAIYHEATEIVFWQSEKVTPESSLN